MVSIIDRHFPKSPRSGFALGLKIMLGAGADDARIRRQSPP
jgi:hypothetical protein